MRLSDGDWVKLGERYHRLGRLDEAQDAYQRAIAVGTTRSITGAAAYRLGVLHFNRGKYALAAPSFELASREAASDTYRYQAGYYHARALQHLDQADHAYHIYSRLIAHNPGSQTDHFYEKSCLEAARIQAGRGHHETAQASLSDLMQEASTPSVRDEALVHSCMLALESRDLELAHQRMDQLKAMPEDSTWRSYWDVADIHLAHQHGDHQRIVDIYQRSAVAGLTSEYRADMLMKVAEAFQAGGDRDTAHRLFGVVSASHRDKAVCAEAGYRRLVLLHQKGDTHMPSEIRSYLAEVRAHMPSSHFIDRASLMLAEWYFFDGLKAKSGNDQRFAKAQFGNALVTYRWLRTANLEASHRPTWLSHQIWAQYETGALGTADQQLRQLRSDYPDHPDTISAMAKRAETHLERRYLDSARAAFHQIIADYPEAPEAEVAMERIGRIYATEKLWPETIDAYGQYIARYPEAAACDAHYWIGVAHYELEQHARAIEHLTQARELAPDDYFNQATIRIIVCHHAMSSLEELAHNCRLYHQRNADLGIRNTAQRRDTHIPVPTMIYRDLGMTLAQEEKWIDAEHFLTKAIERQTPDHVDEEIWKNLAEARLRLDDYVGSIVAYDHYLIRARDAHDRGRAYLRRGYAQMALGDYALAKRSAYECMRVIRQGRLNADARILIGDISREMGDYQAALAEYQIVSVIFKDPEITPLAIQKAISTHRIVGDSQQVAFLEEHMAQTYPEYGMVLTN